MAKLLLFVLAVTASFAPHSGFIFKRDQSDCKRLQDTVKKVTTYMDEEVPAFKDQVVPDFEIVLGEGAFLDPTFWCSLADVRNVDDFAELTGFTPQQARRAYSHIQRVTAKITSDVDRFINSAPPHVKDLPPLVAELFVAIKKSEYSTMKYHRHAKFKTAAVTLAILIINDNGDYEYELC